MRLTWNSRKQNITILSFHSVLIDIWLLLMDLEVTTTLSNSQNGGLTAYVVETCSSIVYHLISSLPLATCSTRLGYPRTLLRTIMMQVFLGNALIFRCFMDCINLPSVAIPSSATQQARIWPTSWQRRWWNWTMNTRRGRWNSANISHQLGNLGIWSFPASTLICQNIFVSQLVWIGWININY